MLIEKKKQQKEGKESGTWESATARMGGAESDQATDGYPAPGRRRNKLEGENVPRLVPVLASGANLIYKRKYSICNAGARGGAKRCTEESGPAGFETAGVTGDLKRETVSKQ